MSHDFNPISIKGRHRTQPVILEGRTHIGRVLRTTTTKGLDFDNGAPGYRLEFTDNLTTPNTEHVIETTDINVAPQLIHLTLLASRLERELDAIENKTDENDRLIESSRQDGRLIARQSKELHDYSSTNTDLRTRCEDQRTHIGVLLEDQKASTAKTESNRRTMDALMGQQDSDNRALNTCRGSLKSLRRELAASQKADFDQGCRIAKLTTTLDDVRRELAEALEQDTAGTLPPEHEGIGYNASIHCCGNDGGDSYYQRTTGPWMLGKDKFTDCALVVHPTYDMAVAASVERVVHHGENSSCDWQVGTPEQVCDREPVATPGYGIGFQAVVVQGGKRFICRKGYPKSPWNTVDFHYYVEPKVFSTYQDAIDATKTKCAEMNRPDPATDWTVGDVVTVRI